VKKSYSFLFLGSCLFLLYILQYLLDLKWRWLYNLQLDEEYKRWSGVFVGVFLLFQWILTMTRVIKKWRRHSIRFTVLHKWVGVISPIFFYIHALEFGYGYLALLSYVFFINMILGTFNLDILKSQKEWVFKSWMISHVVLSIVITCLAIFHIGVVFYYE